MCNCYCRWKWTRFGLGLFYVISIIKDLILDEVVCIFYTSNVFGKGMHPTILLPKLGLATSLREGKLWIQKLHLCYILVGWKGYYIYVGHLISFGTFFCIGIKNFHRLLKVQYIVAIHLMSWLTKFYDFRFKWTATAVIGIHSTKAWLSQLEYTLQKPDCHKNAIWTWGHFRRTICNKILF